MLDLGFAVHKNERRGGQHYGGLVIKEGAARWRASRWPRVSPTLTAALVVLTAGAAYGAVLSEDPGDQSYLTIKINEALETTRSAVEIPWRNSETGTQGTMVIERTYYRDPTTPCRDYRRTVQRPGKPAVEFRGTGCRIGKALWSLDEVEVAPGRRSFGAGGPSPLPLSPPSAAPAAKPPESSRSPSAGKTPAGAATAPPPQASEPAQPPPFPKYTMPSKADL